MDTKYLYFRIGGDLNDEPDGSAHRRRPGRPATVRKDDVAAAGLHAFLRDGFDRVTMSQVALEAGIGRKTLFAYFPTKADIVWNRFSRQLTDLTAALDRAPSRVAPTRAVVDAVLTGLHLAPEELPIVRAEVVLIRGTPSLDAYAHVAGQPWKAAITEFLARRSGQRSTDVLPQVVGQGFWLAMLVGLDHWIESGDQEPQKHVKAAMTEYAEAVRGAFRSRGYLRTASRSRSG